MIARQYTGAAAGLVFLSALTAGCLSARSDDSVQQSRPGGRGGKVSDTTKPNDATVSAEQPFSLSGGRSAIRQPKNRVARDAKAFVALWAEHAKSFDGTVPPAPKVDFKKFDVVAVFLGSIPTGGHAVEIGDIKRTGRKAVVTALHMKPGPGAMVTQAFTYPFAMRAVPKLPPTVTFVAIEKTYAQP